MFLQSAGTRTHIQIVGACFIVYCLRHTLNVRTLFVLFKQMYAVINSNFNVFFFAEEQSKSAEESGHETNDEVTSPVKETPDNHAGRCG